MRIRGLLLASLLLRLPLPAQTAATAPTVDVKEMKAENARVTELNHLLTQINAATRAGDWAKEKNLAEKVIATNAKLMAAYPHEARFAESQPAYYALLGNVHLNLGESEEAVAAYEKCVEAGQSLIDHGTNSPEIENTIGKALTSEGNALLSLKKNREAIACFERATRFAAHPAVAWFNLCVTEYNIGDTGDALIAADKAIALDPTRADAYFIKGSILFADAKKGTDGKITVPEAGIVALKKYLKLAPTGAHTGEAMQMLNYAGAR